MLQTSDSTSIIKLFYIDFSIKVLKLSQPQDSIRFSRADTRVKSGFPTFRELTPSPSLGCPDGLVAPKTDD